MTKEEKLAEEYARNTLMLNEKDPTFRAMEDAFLAGIKAGKPQWHSLSKNPSDLPRCDENTQLIFYVKEWDAIRNDYYYHFALGFYRPSFVIDGGKMFVEECRGYSCEHSPKRVIMWKELVPPEEGKCKL